MNTPNFSPTGGVGTIWKDPASGKTWKYTANGWQEDSGNVVQDSKDKGTFVVKPEEEAVVTTLKSGGAKDADIQSALKLRQQILANKPKQEDTAISISDSPIATITQDSKDPFRGKTKAEVLREAFNNGVTDNKELDNLGKTYDMLATPQATGTMDLSTLSPAQREAAKASLVKNVMTKVMELPDAQTRQAALGAMTSFDAGKDIIKLLEENKVETGLTKGTLRQGVFGLPGGRSLGKTTADEDYFAALTETFAAQFRKALSGTAVSEPEMKRLDKFLPSETKTKQANIEGIKALSDYLSTQISLTTGVDVSILKPEDADKDPLKLNSSTQTSTKNYLGI